MDTEHRDGELLDEAVWGVGEGNGTVRSVAFGPT